MRKVEMRKNFTNTQISKEQNMLGIRYANDENALKNDLKNYVRLLEEQRSMEMAGGFNAPQLPSFNIPNIFAF